MTKGEKHSKLDVDEGVDEVSDSKQETTEDIAKLGDTNEAVAVPRKKSRTTAWWRRKKVLVSIIGLLLVAGIVTAVPFLRYGVVGLFVHKSVALKVVDDASGKPVSGVVVTVGSVEATTNKDGIAKFSNIVVGDHFAKAEKKYYGTWNGSVLVPIFSDVKNSTLKMRATGRTVTVKVLQSITAKPVSNVNVSIGDTSAVTDDTGEASVVVSVGSTASEGKVSADRFVSANFNFNPKATEDQVVEVKIVPTGKVYYLSKATGVISVMSANLDGSDAKTIVAGTGREYDQDTAITATSDWKYLILNANREGKTKLYLVNTADGSLTKIDNDDVNYQMVGWIGSSFVYVVSRDRAAWQTGQSAIKSFDAETRKSVVIDETQAAGTSYYDYQGQYISAVGLTTDRIIYAKSWSSNNQASLDGKKTQIMSASASGAKLTLKEANAAESSIGAVRVHAPNAVYVSEYSTKTNASVVYDVVDGKLSRSQLDDTAMNNMVLPTYLVSPGGTKTAWSDTRDGKNLVFLGDSNANSPKQLVPVGYSVYGWMTDTYLLLTKSKSELYIYPVDGSVEVPVKITDYHKPMSTWMGIGYGGGA